MNWKQEIKLTDTIQLKKIEEQTDKEILKRELGILKDKQIELFLGFDEEIEKEIEIILKKIKDDKSYVYYMIYEKGEFVGIFYLYDMKPEYHRANISLGIVPEKRGHILSIKIVEELIKELFQAGLIRIGVEIEDTNEKSLKMIKHLEKIGFQYEGKLRDNYGEGIHSNIWSLLKKEFKQIV